MKTSDRKFHNKSHDSFLIDREQNLSLINDSHRDDGIFDQMSWNITQNQLKTLIWYQKFKTYIHIRLLLPVDVTIDHRRLHGIPTDSYRLTILIITDMSRPPRSYTFCQVTTTPLP